LDIDHEAGLGQLLFQSSFLCFQLGDPLLLPVTRRSPPRLGQTSQGPDITGPAPVHEMTGVQALTAQHRTLLTAGGSLIGCEDLQLVLRGERPPPGPLRHLGVRTLHIIINHQNRILDHNRGVEHSRSHRHLREVSIPALGSLIVRERVPHTRLTDRGLGRRGQRPLPVNTRRQAPCIALRNPPHADNRVGARAEHQLLQVSDPLEVPNLRRREDLNPPGMSGDFEPWEGWSHARRFEEAVPG